MNLKGSKTEKNLELAIAEESKAQNAYRFYAEAANRANLPLVADVFLDIAQNEEEHARAQFGFLGKIKDTRDNLEDAVHKESYERTSFYPECARVAGEEGFAEISSHFQRLAKVEHKHEDIFDKLLKYLQDQSPINERTSGHSAITLAQVMLPHQANRAGNVHGGEIMKMMDSAAGVAASRHAHSNVVTAKVEDINFLKPVKVGNLVFAHARLVFVSRTSMEIRVEVETEDRFTEERQKALTATFIFVALDPSGKSMEVPSLLITTEEGQRLFEEGRKRYESRKNRT
jgi:uncharacterized protein (TIGR00369 family)